MKKSIKIILLYAVVLPLMAYPDVRIHGSFEQVVAQNKPSPNPQEPEAKRKPTPAGRQKTKSVKQRQARQPSASQRKAKKSSSQLSQNEMGVINRCC